MKASGRNTAAVVSVDARTGIASSCAPRRIASRRSPLAETPAVHHVVHDATGLRELELDPAGGGLILVDDAALVDDPDGVFAALVEGRHGSLHVVAAGDADMIRAAYGHWTTKVRRSRLGLALRPNVAADGDLWQTTLPRRGPAVWPTGRGYLIAEGRSELVQAAWR